VTQRALLAQVDATAGAALPYADFDIVTLAGGADPEAVARRLSEQPDVEYAQARYRVRPMFVPNDTLYSRQWNFPQIDVERAWDINRGGSSNVVVAVVDTGVAFRSGTLRFTAMAWQRDDGVNFPALGQVDVPFAAAPTSVPTDSSPRATSSGTTTCRSTWPGTVPTWRAPSGSSRTTAWASPGWRSTCG
jgi:hypothetical protein